MSELTRDDLRVMFLCGHQGTFHPKGSLLDGTKRHPLGEPIGFNRGGGATYVKWCPGSQWAEFDAIARKLGYVKLDVDQVEAPLRRLAANPSVRDNTSIGIMRAIDAILAALDPEGVTDG